ncbi:putative aar2 protein [Echria macrotheca]|uniref:Aar2 protein n=1 Tax=Echria macrotheca TaxID=438768 RepID=A0AAJ0F0Y9_9PEZI|nr:putative aar2 protein [Echria macrotheca]
MIGSITEERGTVSPPPYLAKGDVFRLLDLPAGFMVGYDASVITTRDSLQGFRDIPPGVHFLWVQHPNPSPRYGYWFITKQPPVARIKQWDKFNEVLGEVASQYEAREQENNIGATYGSLLPWYSAGESSTNAATEWSRLTDAISVPFLGKVTGKKRVDEWLVETMDCVKGESRLAPDMTTTTDAYKTIVGSELQFSFAQDFEDLRVLGQDADADTTNRVLSAAGRDIWDQDIVAELQFTFITGIYLANHACLSQWWSLVLRIVLRSFRLALERPLLCRSLLSTLHAQLVFANEHLGAVGAPERDGLASNPLFDISSGKTLLLKNALAEYKRHLDPLLLELGGNITQDQEAAGRAFSDLEAWLWDRGWDLRNQPKGRTAPVLDEEEDDDDDEKPVVVHLDEDGKEIGLVNFDRD